MLIVSVLATLQVTSCFDRRKPSSLYKEQIEQKDKRIEELGNDRDRYRTRYDSIIAVQKTKDTVIIREIKNNTIKYEQVRDRVNSLSNDELRRAITDF